MKSIITQNSTSNEKRSAKSWTRRRAASRTISRFSYSSTRWPVARTFGFIGA